MFLVGVKSEPRPGPGRNVHVELIGLPDVPRDEVSEAALHLHVADGAVYVLVFSRPIHMATVLRWIRAGSRQEDKPRELVSVIEPKVKVKP